jgi:hypothetical protein
MTKTILLSGGPDDGRHVDIPEENTIHIIYKQMNPIGKTAGIVGAKKGVYKAGEHRLGVQVFTWVGWEEQL